MVEYNKANVRFSDLQGDNLKNAVKNKTGVRMSMKMFNVNSFSHQLLSTTWQKTNLKNISTDRSCLWPRYLK